MVDAGGVFIGGRLKKTNPGRPGCHHRWLWLARRYDECAEPGCTALRRHPEGN